MDTELPRLVRKAYESLLGRHMTDQEVEQYTLDLRRFAEFLLDCSRDRRLMRKLGLRPSSIDAPKEGAYDAEDSPGGTMAVVTPKGSGAVGEISFTVRVLREGRLFVAHTPDLDISSAGETVEAAKVHLLEAVEAFLEEAQRMGTLADILEEAGYERTPEGWKAPDLLTQERAKVALPR